MRIKRIAIGFAVTLAMAFCLSLVSGKTEHNKSLMAEDRNNQNSEYSAQ